MRELRETLPSEVLEKVDAVSAGASGVACMGLLARELIETGYPTISYRIADGAVTLSLQPARADTSKRPLSNYPASLPARTGRTGFWMQAEVSRRELVRSRSPRPML